MRENKGEKISHPYNMLCCGFRMMKMTFENNYRQNRMWALRDDFSFATVMFFQMMYRFLGILLTQTASKVEQIAAVNVEK